MCGPAVCSKRAFSSPRTLRTARLYARVGVFKSKDMYGQTVMLGSVCFKTEEARLLARVALPAVLVQVLP